MKGKFKRELRARAHHLHPVVQIGSTGLSDALVAELEQALLAHELVKVRLAARSREQRARQIERLCEQTGATFVQRIGHVAVLYRSEEPKP